MPNPVSFKSTEQDDPAGHLFTTQPVNVGGTVMHVAGGQEVLGQPNFQNGAGTITVATVPLCLSAATAGDFSSEKSVADGCSRLLLHVECTDATSEVKLRVWWKDVSATTKTWMLVAGGDYAWLRPTGVATDSAEVPGYLGAGGYHVESALIPVHGKGFKVEVLDVGVAGNLVSVWAEGV